MKKTVQKIKKDAGKKKERKPRANHQPIPPEITEERERKAYELRIIQGMKLHEITAELNKLFPAYPLKSDSEAVRKMIMRVQDQYATRDKEKIDAVLAEAAATLDWVRKISIDAIGSTPNPKIDTPIYLKRLLEAVDQKSKLFGVVAPKKHELTGKDGAPLNVPALDMMKNLKEYLSDGDLDTLQKAAEVLERAQRAYDLAVETGNRSRETEPQS